MDINADGNRDERRGVEWIHVNDMKFVSWAKKTNFKTRLWRASALDDHVNHRVRPEQ